MIYFVFLAIGLGIGSLIGGLNAEKDSLPFDDVKRFILTAILASIVGARLFHVLFEGFLDYYLQHPTAILLPWNGGLSVWGGLIAALLAILLVFRKQRNRLIELLDCFSPAFLFGLGVTRIGCFLQGCCYGKPTNLPWGITYRKGSHAFLTQLDLGLIDSDALRTLPIHPTQIYESIAAISAGLVLQMFLRRGHDKGNIFMYGMLSYAVIRFVNEFFRADNRGFVEGIPIPQIISAFLIISIISIKLWRRRLRTQLEQYSDIGEKP